MYQNARETQLGLREQRPTRTKDTNLPPHHKDGSYSGMRVVESGHLNENFEPNLFTLIYAGSFMGNGIM